MGIGRIARRGFLGLGIAAAGGLAVGYYLWRRPFPNPLEAAKAEGEAVFNPYVKVGADGVVTVIAPRAEMGQGVQTTLAALVAEELDVTLAAIRVEHGPPGWAYYNEAMLKMGGPFPFFDEGIMAGAMRGAMGVAAKFLGLQMTGGSSSMVDGFDRMRLAGAAARAVLVAAAASRWGLPAAGLRTEAGEVLAPDGRRLAYGALALEAAALAPPPDLRPKDPAAWRILGRPQDRVEGRAKVTGAPVYGIDVERPGMLHAAPRLSPRFGARARRMDDAAARAIPGVLRVVPLDCPAWSGFAVVAETTWAAFRGAAALEIDWGAAPYPPDDAGIGAVYRRALEGRASFTLGGAGDTEAAFAASDPATILEAEYEVPFLAHACMEPLNATAEFRDGRLTLWTGTQAPGIDAILCARLLGIRTGDVTVHVTQLGGGFGRRAMDAAMLAALVAKAVEGRPVKLTWPREEDMRHDFYRPRALARMRAVVPEGSPPRAFEARVAAPSVVASVLARSFPELPAPPEDDSILDGMFNQPLAFPASRHAAHVVDLPVPVGFWRSVGNSFNGFFHECFLDEAAAKAGMDPIAMRLALMRAPEHAPARRVLERLREVSGWGAPLPAGRGRGVAFVLSFGTWVGQVVEVETGGDGLRIAKVWCVADPGRVLDPRNFRAQMVSGIVFGLSAALGQEITFRDGMVEQGNFDAFDAMRMHQCPEIEVHLLETARRMGGAGEPGTPPAAPALANAIFAATGVRLRRMPFGGAVRFA